MGFYFFFLHLGKGASYEIAGLPGADGDRKRENDHWMTGETAGSLSGCWFQT
jgi:hypothetical protein